MPYGEAGPGEPGSTMVVSFELLGQEHVAINGGPQFPFTEAVSFEVRCDDQARVEAAARGMLGMKKLDIAELERAYATG